MQKARHPLCDGLFKVFELVGAAGIEPATSWMWVIGTG